MFFKRVNKLWYLALLLLILLLVFWAIGYAFCFFRNYNNIGFWLITFLLASFLSVFPLKNKNIQFDQVVQALAVTATLFAMSLTWVILRAKYAWIILVLFCLMPFLTLIWIKIKKYKFSREENKKSTYLLAWEWLKIFIACSTIIVFVAIDYNYSHVNKTFDKIAYSIWIFVFLIQDNFLIGFWRVKSILYVKCDSKYNCFSRTDFSNGNFVNINRSN